VLYLDFYTFVRVICPKIIRHIAFAALTWVAYNAYAAHPSGDVVTLKNGDIYIGNIQQASFIIHSRYGELDIPGPYIQRLEFRSGGRDIQLKTYAGELIRGSLNQGDIRVSRLQDPTLPIALEDISYIEFGHQQATVSPADFPSLLETSDGEILFVKLVPGSLILETDKGPVDISTADLRYIDTSLHTYEDQLLTQLTLDGDKLYQGQLTPPGIKVQSPYLDSMDVPANILSRLTLDRTVQTGQSEQTFSDSLRTLGSGPHMIRIPGGRFLRGDHQGDGDDDEQPMSEVSLHAFAISTHEITFNQYDLYCQRSRKCDEPDDQEWGRGNRPVINVSWEEANAYVQWLADKTGKPYRLPSDAEWEYAHRAGNTTRYAWGDEVESARANCEGCGSIWDGDQSAPVGRFEANAYGLYDTAGNVFEWVADCFHDRFSEAPNDGSPIEKEGCGKRVIRGGAWSFPPHEVRSANRWRDFPTRRSDDTGFRVAMDLR